MSLGCSSVYPAGIDSVSMKSLQVFGTAEQSGPVEPGTSFVGLAPVNGPSVNVSNGVSGESVPLDGDGLANAVAHPRATRAPAKQVAVNQRCIVSLPLRNRIGHLRTSVRRTTMKRAQASAGGLEKELSRTCPDGGRDRVKI